LNGVSTPSPCPPQVSPAQAAGCSVKR
jgi:hypothetical protein